MGVDKNGDASSSGPKRLIITDGVSTALDSNGHALYFIRTTQKKEGVGEKGCEQDMMSGEIRGGALDSFRALIGNLYAPVLKQQNKMPSKPSRKQSLQRIMSE